MARRLTRSLIVAALITFLVAPMTVEAAPAFPIKISADGRHLEDQNGNAFTVQGMTAWSLLNQLSLEDAVAFLENRRQKGFNTLLIDPTGHKFSDNAPRNYYNIAPFTVSGDFSTPNPAYFAYVDQVLDAALQKGFWVLMTPMYFGYGGGNEGWWQEIVSNGPSKCYSYGQFLGNRYRNYPNIVWLLGGDYNPPAGNQGEINAIEMVKGLRSSDREDRLYTYHGNRRTTAMDQAAFRPYINLNAVYTGPTDIYQYCLNANSAHTMPTFLLEAYYENEHSLTPLGLRKQAYWALTSCTAGQIFGNAPLWYFGSFTGAPFADDRSVTWQAALERPGSLDQARLISLFEQHVAASLVPDQDHQVITSGYGAYGSDTYATAAYKPDRTLAISYSPAARTLTVNLSWFASSVSASWFDPTSGSLAPIAGSPFQNSGSRHFTTPGINQAGSADWILVLRASGGVDSSPPAAPGNLRIS